MSAVVAERSPRKRSSEKRAVLTTVKKLRRSIAEPITEQESSTEDADSESFDIEDDVNFETSDGSSSENEESRVKAEQGVKKGSAPVPQSTGSGARTQTSIDEADEGSHWQRLHLGRPLLKALAELGFKKPTKIQQDTIPLALQGKDILGTAQTGSGKTAAFLLPILERLCRSPMVRQRKIDAKGIVRGGMHATKALILLPTRELAVQCHEMLEALAKYTPMTRVLVTGGLAQKSQEQSLKQQPDIVVATPGRVLDLLLNALNVHMELLEIVVLDEADRLLDLGFKRECLEVLRQCSNGRQTLLFSATLSDALRDLAALSLKQPIRVDAHASHSVPTTLEQIMVPVPAPMREHSEDEAKVLREATLLALLLPSDGAPEQRRTMVFFNTKRQAHRAALLLRLLEVQHAELHGNLSQAKRLEALARFQAPSSTDGEGNSVNLLLCSELAARGLDLPDVERVINFDVPTDSAKYTHQVGRTARQGRAGTAITLFAPTEKKQLKKTMKVAMRGKSSAQADDSTDEDNNGTEANADVKNARVRPLKVDFSIVDAFRKKIAGLEKKIKSILQEEHAERELRVAEMELAKVQNIRRHEDEILARPQKRWILNHAPKKQKRSEKIR